MYRGVGLSQQDKDLHRFLWREDPQQPVQEFRMTRVTFGVSSSPYMAIKTLQKTADDHGQDHPDAAHHIRTSFYVDDLLAGATTEEETLDLYVNLRSTLALGGFNLCKWRSSSSEVLDSIPTELQEQLPVKEMTGDPSSTQPKVLGLEWDSRLDLMAPAIKLAAYYKETKRGVVADVSRTFDILGWISPAVVLMKLLYQKLWQLKIGWDEPVPDDLIKLHSTWRKQLPVLCNKKIPRYYCRSHSSLISRELHGFADASAKAYGAVVYLRTTYHHHPPLLSLVVSKTRVAKLTPSTIPRQELCAAVLLTELLSEVKTILNIPDEMVYAWSDSSIVLSWLDGHPRDYKVFVTNRVSSILQVTTPSTWRHVPTTDNPADCASRGLMPEELLNHTLWWEGPEWLLHQPITIPHQPPRKPLLGPEQRPHRVNVVHFTPPPMMETRFSNYHKMIKVTAWCWRFCQKVRKKSSHSGRLLASQELTTAEHLLARLAQSRSFPKERDALLHNRPIPSTSRILSLTPYLDENQLLRVGGRLSNNSSLTPSQVHPIIQDSSCHYCLLTCMGVLATVGQVCFYVL